MADSVPHAGRSLRATVHLSTQVFQALLGEADGRPTVLLISHKMSTVERANHIVVLEEGRVAEEGAHLELMQRGGHYAQMVAKYNQGFQRQGR